MAFLKLILYLLLNPLTGPFAWTVLLALLWLFAKITMH